MDYICGYCGKAYSTIGERMECEKKCHDKKIQEEENLKKSKRDDEMKKDLEEITALSNERDKMNTKIAEMVKEYDKKYNVFEYSEFPYLFRPLDTFFRI